MLGTHRNSDELDPRTIQTWIEAGWLRPTGEPLAQSLSVVDLARARFIRDLKRDMGVNDDGVDVVLDLVDQIHGLRSLLDEVVSAICVQPDAIQRRIVGDARRLARLERLRRSCRNRSGLHPGR